MAGKSHEQNVAVKEERYSTLKTLTKYELSLLVDEYQWFFPRWQSSRGAKPVTHLHLVHRLGIMEAIPPHPNTPSW